MSTIVKLPSGRWRAQVRRNKKYVSRAFLRNADTTTWAMETELAIDKGLSIATGQRPALDAMRARQLFHGHSTVRDPSAIGFCRSISRSYSLG